MEVRRIEAKNGETNLLYGGQALYSRYAPRRTVERLVEEAPLLEECIYLVPSPLLGYGLKELLTRIPSTSCLLCLEADQVLLAHSAPALLSLGLKEVPVYRVSTPPQLYEVFKKLQDGRYRRVFLQPLNGGYRIQKKCYDLLLKTLDHFLQNYWHNRLTQAKMGFLWIKNSFANLPALGRTRASWQRNSRPIVVAGAGESLEGCLATLQRFRPHFYLLAVDTAVQSLLAQGLCPDGVVNLESQFYNLKDFYSLQGRRVELFSDLSAYPPSLRGDHSLHFFASTYQETAFHRRLREEGFQLTEVPPLGSVGVTALYLAGLLSRGPIFLTGLDFSYREGKTHAKEGPFHSWCRLGENRLSGDRWYGFSKSRPGQPTGGGLVTNPVLLGYAELLKNLLGTMENPVYDLRSQGLSLGLPPLGAEDFAALCQSDGEDNQENLSSPPFPSDRMEGFIQAEAGRLEGLIGLWDQLSRGEVEAEALLAPLKACDYLYFHYPDREELPHAQPPFLFKVIRDARRLLRILRIGQTPGQG